MTHSIDLREGFRVEVEATVMPPGVFAARLYGKTPGGRWKRVGPPVLADGPEKAARDLLTAANTGLLTGVEVKG